MTLKEWQEKKRLSDSDIFSQEYLSRTKLGDTVVQCACGCGYWRVRHDKKGIGRRFIQGHQSRGRKTSAETLQKRRETRHKNQELSEKRRLMRKHGKLFKNLEKAFKNGGSIQEYVP